MSFFRNRVYDQVTGRWTQEDPLGVAGGLNLYQFSGNNPAAFTDPFGLCPDPKNPKCPQTEGGSKGTFTGFVVNGVFGTGVTAALGAYSTDEGSGTYFRFGVGVGLDVSGGVEGGTFRSMDNFSGDGEATYGGAYVANGCAGNSPGKPEAAVKSSGVAIGPTEALPVSAHAERTHTVVSKPQPHKTGCGESYCPTAVK